MRSFGVGTYRNNFYHQFYQEFSKLVVMSLLSKYYLKNCTCQEDVWKQDAGNGKIRVDILKLRQILADKSILELVNVE